MLRFSIAQRSQEILTATGEKTVFTMISPRQKVSELFFLFCFYDSILQSLNVLKIAKCNKRTQIIHIKASESPCY